MRQRSVNYDEAKREAFLMGMFNIAMSLAPKVANELDLAGRKHLLDLGGGPGTYAIHFCKRYPELRATVCDLATTRPFAEKTIARFGLSDRIEFVALDYLSQDVPGSFDAAWVSFVLHAEGPANCRMIIQKAVAALEPGGLIAIHEFVLDDTMDSPLGPALFSLNMLLGTAQGQAYSDAQIKAMLADNGIEAIRRLPFRGPTESAIIAGTKPIRA
jgi:predicted O-methyltransferase YrrM